MKVIRMNVSEKLVGGVFYILVLVFLVIWFLVDRLVCMVFFSGEVCMMINFFFFVFYIGFVMFGFFFDCFWLFF